MKFASSGFFALRTPLLSFDEFLQWSEGLEAAGSLDSPANLASAAAADRLRLRARLVEIVFRPAVREALFVASPDLEESLDIWAKNPESERGQRVELALVRYFARMAGRATPFGLCAGCSVGTTGVETRLELVESHSYRRHTRLDMDYLHALCEALARDRGLRRTFVYHPNSSLYSAAGRVRYAESRLEGKNRSYHLVAVQQTDSLTQTLAAAQAGTPFEALATALVDDDISQAEAEAYIGELADSQIIVPDVALRITGSDPLDVLVRQLAQSPATQPMADTLCGVAAELAALDRTGVGQSPERYRAIARGLEKLPVKVELPRLFQVDMIKPSPATTLSKTVLSEIMRGVEVLRRLAPPIGGSNELTRFRDAFVERYGSREVPVTEALDAETGIGFPLQDGPSADGSPLLHGLAFPGGTEETVRWRRLESFLLRRLSESLQRGDGEIILQPGELENISAREPPALPDAFCVIASLASASEAEISRGDFRVYLQGAYGPSGARFLGRFCYADEMLHREVKRHLREEEALRPEAVFAEVVHLREGRLGNILTRPVLRDYEIVYLARGAVPLERQIPVTDLSVAVQGDRIVLRSARLGREVIPRLTSAHAFHWRNLGLYHFLCILQGQNVAEKLAWSWGALRSAPFLPRVSMGRLVLSRAQWYVEKEELQRLGKERGVARFRSVDAWRKARQLPKLVNLADGDNTLPIDFDNVLSVDTFVNLTKSADEAILIEMFPPPDALCAHGPEGRFVHELIIPFVRTAGQEETRTPRAQRTTPPRPQTATRSFVPGSEWLYAKLYTGTATADRLLQGIVRPLIKRLRRSGAIDRWFFIRYRDPDWHVRLRVHGRAHRLNSEVLPALHAAVAPLLDDQRIWRLQFDTYEREVERYGGAAGVLLAEQIFHVDSEAALEIIARLESGDAGLDERWRLTLRGMDMLLHDLDFDSAAKKLAVVGEVRAALAYEFRANGELKSQLGNRFRQERKELEALLDSTQDAESSLSSGFEVLRQRSVRLAPIVAELKRCAQSDRLTTPITELAPSYIHMHANRMLRSEHRAHELVLYDFLARLYDGQIARGDFQIEDAGCQFSCRLKVTHQASCHA